VVTVLTVVAVLLLLGAIYKYGRGLLEQSSSEKRPVFEHLVGSYVEVAFGARMIRVYTGTLERVEQRGVVLRNPTGSSTALDFGDIQWVSTGRGGPRWDFSESEPPSGLLPPPGLRDDDT